MIQYFYKLYSIKSYYKTATLIPWALKRFLVAYLVVGLILAFYSSLVMKYCLPIIPLFDH